MKFLIGRKQNMTQVYADDGRATPVTTIKIEPVTLVRSKTVNSDGYESAVVGYGVQKESRINKAQLPMGLFTGVKEARGSDIELGGFALGDKVAVSGISKGRGFQGVVKRHGFHGGRRTHGQKHSEREPGSIGGAGRAGGRVVKGMRMAGRMGTDRVTVRNLKVMHIDEAGGLLMLKGAIPGRRGTLVELRGV